MGNVPKFEIDIVVETKNKKGEWVRVPSGGRLPVSEFGMAIGRHLFDETQPDTQSISKHHCNLKQTNGHWQVSDCSSHGTKILRPGRNDVLLKGTTALIQIGDMLVLGNAGRLLIGQPAPAEPGTAPPAPDREGRPE